MARKAAQLSGISLERVLTLKSGEDRDLTVMDSGESAVSEALLPWERITNEKELEDTLIYLFYSSGTTGVPKGM